MVNKDETDSYVRALEEELCASIQREKELLERELSFRTLVMGKIKKTSLYNKVLSEPDSKIGKIVRGPRSFYRIIKNPEVRKNIMQKKTVNEVDLGSSSTGHFLDPWIVDSGRRKEIADGALKDGKRLVLYFVEKPDSSTFRYRCYNTFEATLRSQKWQAVYFFKDEVEIVEELLSKSSLLILGRQSGQERLVNKLVDLAHANSIKIGLDIDDLVFDMKYLDVMLDTIGEKTNKSYWLAYFASVQMMARRMDCFVTTNKFIADKLRGDFDRPVRIIRNSLNAEQIDASLVYMGRKLGRDNGFVVGYFSGSPTHAKDFAVVEPELIRFLKEHKDVTLNVVGYMRFSKEAEELVESNRITVLPFTDFRKLQRLMAEVDVNIAPLVINDFTNCKSELKFFEAAVVETTTIASPTYAFKKAIKDGENGFLAQPGEWYSKLNYLYEHPKENRKVALAAKEYALKHYYGKEFLREVEEAYDHFAK